MTLPLKIRLLFRPNLSVSKEERCKGEMVSYVHRVKSTVKKRFRVYERCWMITLFPLRNFHFVYFCKVLDRFQFRQFFFKSVKSWTVYSNNLLWVFLRFHSTLRVFVCEFIRVCWFWLSLIVLSGLPVHNSWTRRGRFRTIFVLCMQYYRESSPNPHKCYRLPPLLLCPARVCVCGVCMSASSLWSLLSPFLFNQMWLV